MQAEPLEIEIKSLVINIKASASTPGIEKFIQLPSKYFSSPFNSPFKFFTKLIILSKIILFLVCLFFKSLFATLAATPRPTIK